MKTGTFEQCTEDHLDEVFAINVRGMYMVTRSALPWIMGSRGNIVNISSYTALRPVNDYFAYCLSKVAVDQFTKNLALGKHIINHLLSNIIGECVSRGSETT